MKSFMFLLSMGILLAFAGAAAAAGGTTVTIINGDNTTLQVSLAAGGFSVGPDGTITLSVNEVLQNNSGSGGGCQYTAPTISVSGISSSAISGDTLSGTISASSGATASASYGTVSGSSWSWTAPSVAASTSYTVIFTATTANSCNNVATAAYSVNVSPAGGGGGGGGTGSSLPSARATYTIGALGANTYSLTVGKTASKVTVAMESLDYATATPTDEDLMISTNSQPATCDQMTRAWSNGIGGLWYGPLVGRSNETVTAGGTFNAASVLYVTVCNRTNATGKYYLSWSAY